MILTFRPIKIWPDTFNRQALDRHASPFTASYADTLELLDVELRALEATDVVLQVDAAERDCRLDGQLRADAKVTHPGCILSFTSRHHGALSYPCDRYEAVPYRRNGASWTQNLRAITLGLEALRRVERYGIAERGQQYAGYRELGSGIPMGAAPAMTVEVAGRLLWNAAYGGDWPPPVLNVEIIRGAWRVAATKGTHPDHGGSAAVFRQLTQARDLLLEYVTAPVR